jgi:Ni/Co efflux regulator RcnB
MTFLSSENRKWAPQGNKSTGALWEIRRLYMNPSIRREAEGVMAELTDQQRDSSRQQTHLWGEGGTYPVHTREDSLYIDQYRDI